MHIDLERLKRLAREATPGPWIHVIGEVRTIAPSRQRMDSVVTYDYDPGAASCDGEFIAALNPLVVLELVARIERMRREMERMRQEVTHGRA